MATKPLIITVLAISLILGTSLWVFLRTGMNTPSAQEDNTLVTEEYAGNDCIFRIYEPAQNSFTTPQPDVQKQILCSFTIHQDLPLYIIRIVGIRGQNEIERVEIYPETNPKSIQTFSEFNTYPLTERVFEAKDINFDVYLDIGTIAWYGTAGFTGYQYWIFDPGSNNFLLDTQFVNLANPKLLPEKKQILADDPKKGSVTYEWRAGILTKIEK